MIKTAIQLKTKVRNLSKGDSTKAQTYMHSTHSGCSCRNANMTKQLADFVFYPYYQEIQALTNAL